MQAEWNYKIIRSSRRTIAISITPEGEVEVRAPYRVSSRLLREMVAQREGWIRSHLAKQRERESARASFSLEEGAMLPILGRELPVKMASEGASPMLTEEGFLLPGNGTEAQRRAWVEGIYRRCAQEELPRRVEAAEARTGLSCTGVRITGAKTRWGSCSGKNSLCFSWRLMAAHPRAVDYVVLHELAHTRHHDHSREFWQLVERYEPQWRECRELLKQVQDAAGWL